MEYVITLDPKYVEDAKALELAENVYTKIYMLFKILIKFFFESSKMEDLIKSIFVYIKMQVKNSRITECNSILGQIMLLNINFHKLVLLQDTSCIEFHKLITLKKAVINKKQ